MCQRTTKQQVKTSSNNSSVSSTPEFFTVRNKDYFIVGNNANFLMILILIYKCYSEIYRLKNRILFLNNVVNIESKKVNEEFSYLWNERVLKIQKDKSENGDYLRSNIDECDQRKYGNKLIPISLKIIFA